jgi:hypothetical protein
VIVTDWFGVSVSPEVTPLSLYPVPDTVTPEIVTFEFPLLVSVVVNELLLPTLTLPKARLDVLSPRTRVAATPVPLREIVIGDVGALLTSVIDPVTLPAVLGPNTALNVAALPDPMVNGVVIPVVLKPAPETVTEEIVTVAVPPFVRLMDCELFVPVVTLLNAAVVGVAANCACVPVPLKGIVSGELTPLLTIEMLPLALPADVGANWALNVVLSPAPNVSGVLNPLMLKPVPDAVAWEIVTLPEPEFVNVIDCGPLLPTATDPKFTLDGLAPSWPSIPVPDNAIVAGEPGALLTTEIPPESLPTAGGENFAVNDALLPAAIVIGMLAPLMLNPVPEGDAWVTVNEAFPEFVNVTVCDIVLPTDTLPNVTLAGLIVSCGCEAVPVPDKAITSGEPGALLVIETLPVALPAVVGENFAVNDVLCPAVSVIGAARPVMLNPVPDALPCEIATLAVPEFLRVTLTDALAPESRLPKLMLVGFAVRLPCTPVALSAIATVGLLAVLVIRMLPEAAPTVVGANCAVKVVLWLAASVNGTDRPVALNPLPVALIAEIVALVFPLFVKVIVCGLLLPTDTFPNATLPGFATKVELVATPVPTMLTTCGEPGALSVKVMLPLVAPFAVGANCALKERLSPPVNVFGSDSPLIPKPVPATVAILIVTLEFPLFVSLTLCVPLCPTITFPNVNADGAIVKPACVPVPVIAIASGELEASLNIVKLPFIAPSDIGANWSCIVLLWPTPIVPAGFPPTTVMPAPVMAAEPIVTVPNPVFVTVKLCVAVFPTATLPKLTLVTLGESMPAPAPGLEGWVFGELV